VSWGPEPIADASGPPVGADGRSGPRRVDEGQLRWPLLVVGGLGVVLFLVLLVEVLRWDWWAVGDFGTLRLRTLDVGTAETPLVGIYSRWGWNHPGPMVFYALAAPLRLTGGDGHGLLLGALLVNTAAIGASLVVAARAGRSVLALAALVLALLVVGLDPGGLLDPWNPFILIVPLFAAAISAWRAALGDRVAAVVLVVAGSFAVQAHIGVVAAVGSLFLVAALGLGWRAWRGPDRRSDRRTALVAVVVLAVCWLPPLVQQVTGSPGNLGEIVSFGLDGDEPVNGVADGARRTGQALSLPPIWVTGDITTAAGDHPIPFGLVAVLVAGAWAWRRRWTSELVLCATALALVAGSLLASSRISGVAFPYLFRWLWAVGAFAWFSAAVVAMAELRRRAWSGVAGAVAVGVTAVLVVVLVVPGPDTTALESSDRSLRTFEQLLEPTVEVLRTAPGPTMITVADYGVDGSMGIELLARADDEGIDVRYPSDAAYVFGSFRTIDPAEARSELVLASSPESRARLAVDPRFRLVAEYDPLTPDERAEYERLAAIDWSSRPDGPSDPGPEYERLLELSETFESLAVFYADQPPG
jgi:hypothetical protein